MSLPNQWPIPGAFPRAWSPTQDLSGAAVLAIPLNPTDRVISREDYQSRLLTRLEWMVEEAGGAEAVAPEASRLLYDLAGENLVYKKGENLAQALLASPQVQQNLELAGLNQVRFPLEHPTSQHDLVARIKETPLLTWLNSLLPASPSRD